MKKPPKSTKSNKSRPKTVPPKKVTETKAQYELWNLPEYGYVVISSEKGRKVKEGTMIRQGKLSRTANTIFIGLGEFATLKVVCLKSAWNCALMLRKINWTCHYVISWYPKDLSDGRV